MKHIVLFPISFFFCDLPNLTCVITRINKFSNKYVYVDGSLHKFCY